MSRENVNMNLGQDPHERLDRVESYQAIQQLAARYALAVDSKDLDAIADLFVIDVNAGSRWGVGRDAIKAFYRATLSEFYRSIHLIAGHVIDIVDASHGHGVVYCRAEHEMGDGWNVMAMNYADDYEREDGTWKFRRRRLQPLYFVDIVERPGAPDFVKDARASSVRRERPRRMARLPGEWRSFSEFWAEFPSEHVARLTSAPINGRTEGPQR